MSRVIVFDRCGGCPYLTWLIGSVVCSRTGENIDPSSLDFDKYETGAGTPAWCPLRLMPEKKWEPDEADTYDGGYADGWNDCLNMIEGVAGEEKRG